MRALSNIAAVGSTDARSVAAEHVLWLSLLNMVHGIIVRLTAGGLVRMDAGAVHARQCRCAADVAMLHCAYACADGKYSPY